MKRKNRNKKKKKKKKRGALVVGFSSHLQTFLFVFSTFFFFLLISTTFFFLFLRVCMLNSEKLQRVLKLINYKMLYLLWFRPCDFYVLCMHMWYIHRTHIVITCILIDSKQNLPFIPNIGKRVSNLPCRRSFLLHVLLSCSSQLTSWCFACCFFLCVCVSCTVKIHMMKLYSKEEKNDDNNKRMNEWKISTVKIAYRDYGGV